MPGLAVAAVAAAGFTQMATVTSAAAAGTAAPILHYRAPVAPLSAAPAPVSAVPAPVSAAPAPVSAVPAPVDPLSPVVPSSAPAVAQTPALTPATSVPTVTITKLNNAAGTGYGTSETAAAGITSIPYQVVVTNPNAQAGTIIALTDTANGSTMNICPNLIGKVLQPFGQPDDSATCDFTGPVPTSPSTDTASTTLSVNGAPATASATSTVFPPVLPTSISQTPPAAKPTGVAPPTPTPVALGASTPGVAAARLPTTGAPVRNLLTWAVVLFLGGVGLLGGLFATDPRRRLALAHADAGRHTERAGPVRVTPFPRYPAASGPVAAETIGWSAPLRRSVTEAVGPSPSGSPDWAGSSTGSHPGGSPPGRRPGAGLRMRGPLRRHRDTGRVVAGGPARTDPGPGGRITCHGVEIVECSPGTVPRRGRKSGPTWGQIRSSFPLRTPTINAHTAIPRKGNPGETRATQSHGPKGGVPMAAGQPNGAGHRLRGRTPLELDECSVKLVLPSQEQP